jgi:hypothetical protein
MMPFQWSKPVELFCFGFVVLSCILIVSDLFVILNSKLIAFDTNWKRYSDVYYNTCSSADSTLKFCVTFFNKKNLSINVNCPHTFTTVTCTSINRIKKDVFKENNFLSFMVYCRL